MKETMAMLAENWVVGYSICLVIVLAKYLIFSIRLVITARKIGYDVGAICLVPFVNIVIWVKKCIYSRRLNRPLGEDDIIEL